MEEDENKPRGLRWGMAHLEPFIGKLQHKEGGASPILWLMEPLILQPVYGRSLLESSTHSKQKAGCPQPAGKQTCHLPGFQPKPGRRRAVRNQQSQDQIAAGSSSRDYREGRRGGELEPATSGCLPAPCQPGWGPRWGRASPQPASHGMCGAPRPSLLPRAHLPTAARLQPGMESLSSSLKKKATEQHYRAEVMIAGEQLR